MCVYNLNIYIYYIILSTFLRDSVWFVCAGDVGFIAFTAAERDSKLKLTYD